MIGKFLAASLLIIGSLSALPSQVIVIRHAEKPEKGNQRSTRRWQARVKHLHLTCWEIAKYYNTDLLQL